MTTGVAGDRAGRGAPAPRPRAPRIVDAVLGFHRRWQRAAREPSRAWSRVDPEVRAFYRAQRRRQLDSLARCGTRRTRRQRRAADALLLYTLERVCDAVAEGESRALGVRRARSRRTPHAVVDAALRMVATPRPATTPWRAGRAFRLQGARERHLGSLARSARPRRPARRRRPRRRAAARTPRRSSTRHRERVAALDARRRSPEPITAYEDARAAGAPAGLLRASPASRPTRRTKPRAGSSTARARPRSGSRTCSRSSSSS